MNLVVVSNRVARGKANEPMTGGLAAALLPVVENSGAIWVGSSGRVRDGFHKEPFAEIEALGSGALATIDLPAAHYGGYYEGFANSALWPALHSRSDLIRTSQDDYRSYREVNAFMARALLRFRKTGTAFWVQDYHFLALGAELRELGVSEPIGFFLHTPWPTACVIESVPQHRELVEAMLAFDLIGFQTAQDFENFAAYVREGLGLVVQHDGIVISQHGRTRLQVFPIGIDAEKFATAAAKAVSHPDVSRLRRSLNGERLAIGVDRLDYSKGITHRIQAFGKFLEANPDWAGKVTFLQVTPKSRIEVPEYVEMNQSVNALVGQINGQHGEASWTPIRYVNRSYSRATLAGLYRAARVGFVTPLRDGMNLVAKEYVAAQDPDDPGVLVLSQFAGAAEELSDAIIVNPHETEAMAEALRTALEMPLEERQARHRRMLAHLMANDIDRWAESFLSALADTRQRPGFLEALRDLVTQQRRVGAGRWETIGAPRFARSGADPRPKLTSPEGAGPAVPIGTAEGVGGA